MKKSKLIVCAFLVCASLTAQTEKVKLGVKAGLNISSLTFDENELNSSNKNGFTVGLMAEIPLTKNFFVQPELLYSQQGMKLSYSDAEVENSHYKSTLSLNYLNVPVMLKYYVLKGLSVQAGPQVGILLKANNKYQDNFLGYDNHEKMDLKDYSNGVDASVNFGLGYQFKNKFYADVRYNMSYTDVFKEVTSNTNYSINSDMKNRIFQVTVGYFFK
ncbi:opacity protein-like surface antigen [Flavobacterium nitrogenifigens]|uniref:Opacity protein-like surface antigen n=2 Tax=Flavobacterium TaxID=237 RepID=A0A7W7IXB7_9FLAO|nr:MULTISPECIES: porin family protein [Flavobacterium]MBB4802331.1 opacity protein-like surface antigen [Flavobacterium nitrogenifigens]MBB6387289.1 opacity protein-like surface antigen [Flavobacterium notoginsengisoli]